MPPDDATPVAQRLLLTPGEPAGIGADICLQVLADRVFNDSLHAQGVELYLIADPRLLQARAQRLGLPFAAQIHADLPASLATANPAYRPGACNILPVELAAPAIPGQLDVANAPYVLRCLDRAVDACLAGRASALVTGPVQKSLINEAGIAFTGHTEYLAERAGATPVMMLATDTLRVALATTHLPLCEVSRAITAGGLRQTLGIVHAHLRRHCGIAQPRILVCGLNPHAGESGQLGREEIDIIAPALESVRARGIDAIGPLPADTLFTPRHLQGADAVLAMYHDQGLPVLKYSGFGKAVNITLGLPFVRTSVDHGTALELAATGKADSGSLRQAIGMAIITAKH